MKRFSLHYAWAICLGCTLMLLICCGLCVNAFSVAQPYILAQHGFTNTQTSAITTVRAVSYLLCMALTPWYYKKLGYRLGAALAILFGAGGYALFALAQSLMTHYVAAFFAGLAYGFGSLVPASILIARWFQVQTGLALGICAAGTGVATVVFSPLMQRLIESQSLSACFWAMAAICAASALAVFLLLRDSPDSCGKTPLGHGTPQAAKKEAASLPPPKMSKLRWGLLFLSTCLFGGLASSGITHLMILFTTAGHDPAHASVCVSISGLSLMVSKCLLGALCDKLGNYRVNYLFGAVLLVSLGLCAMVDLGGMALIYAAAILFGLGVPLGTMGLSLWAMDFSHPDSYAKTVRLFQTGYGIGTLAFSFLPGMVADLTGSYGPAYAIFLAAGLFSLAVVQSSYRLKRKAPPT